jgi:hypothetical protein
MKSIRNAQVIGFFSIPSASLAEHNPEAYNNLVRALPEGCGSCSQCGMGITHHIVIRDEDGRKRFVGSDCAEKIGVDADSIRYRKTTEEIAARDAKRQAWAAEYKALKDAEDAKIAERTERFADVVAILMACNSDFHTSLAEQVVRYPLSWKQAGYVAKATSATGRRNKANAAVWDDIEARVQS